MQAARSKRAGPARDKLPDEVFLRLRGALFFGPGFKVTRNKLTFRDTLQELLANASPGKQPFTYTYCLMIFPSDTQPIPAWLPGQNQALRAAEAGVSEGLRISTSCCSSC